MKYRVFIWIIAFSLAGGLFFRWYTSIPALLNIKPNTELANTVSKISEKYIKYKSSEFLVYGTGSEPILSQNNIIFSDGVWLLRSIDPIGSASFGGPNNITGTIKGKGTVFIDFQKNIILSIDALILDDDVTKILPSFYIQNNEKIFYDLANMENLVDKDLWNIYKNQTLKDEREIYGGFSEEEMIKNIKIIIEREPEKDTSKSYLLNKNYEIRIILEDILLYMENVKRQRKCGDSSESCLRFIMNSIDAIKKIDSNLLIGLENSLIMWGKKNSAIDVSYSWESIFQRYHLDVLHNEQTAVSTRDNAIVTMIRTSQKPTYEMWQYMTYIISKERKGSPYSLQLMTEMIRVGEALKNNTEHKKDIVEESNRTLEQLRKVLEETYFDKKDNYLFVLKENLKDNRGQKIDTHIFVNDLNQLITEIDKSTLFLEYPDFRILRRHLSWFTCIFLKNKDYLADIRICRSALE